MEKVTDRIRPIVICLFRNGSRILAAEGIDQIKSERFLRPLGGEVHFGETGLQALEREMSEELGQAIERPEYLGMLENLFTYNGEPGHELVMVFDASFSDKALYKMERIPGRESDGERFNAFWVEPDDAPELLPLYPDGLAGFIRRMGDDGKK